LSQAYGLSGQIATIEVDDTTRRVYDRRNHLIKAVLRDLPTALMALWMSSS
jgi:hypothetical protein